MPSGLVLNCLAVVPLFLPPVAAQWLVFPSAPLDISLEKRKEITTVTADAPPLDGSVDPLRPDGLPARILPVLPIKPAPSPPEPTGVEWGKLGRDSAFFLTIMHTFRWVTEAGTRAGGIGLGSDYVRSVANLHGWADGDPFYVNYLGHPVQGAVSARLYLINDPRFNRTEFGKSPEYWKGKLRATAFAWAFSVQFEIGPVSEASIGHIQKDFPQQGFVDHVVTPTIGLAWMLGEDAVDRYVIRPLEGRTENIWLRLALRTALNPTLSFANLVGGKAPWNRGSRAGIMTHTPANDSRTSSTANLPVVALESKPAPFEFSVASGWRQFAGGACMGGGGEAAYRVSPAVQFALSVNGCKLLGLPENLSGDALIYQIGPRWTPAPTGKWSPYAHVLVGGLKITHEQLYPAKKLVVLAASKDSDSSLSYTLHDAYTHQEEANGVAISFGTGVDYRLNAGLAFRVASVEYLRSSIDNVGGMSYSNGLQVTTGLVLRLGTW